MNKQERDKKILENLFDIRRKKLEPLILDILQKGVENELKMVDFPYIDQRLRELAEETINLTDFHDPVIEKARRDFLNVCFQRALKKKPRPKEWRKRKLDLTQQRDARCEPIVHYILEWLLDPDIIITDTDYIVEAIRDQNELAFNLILTGYIDILTQQFELILNKHFRDAQRMLWDGKDKEQISLKDVDKILTENR